MSPNLADRDPPLGLLFGDVEEETYDDNEASKHALELSEQKSDGPLHALTMYPLGRKIVGFAKERTRCLFIVMPHSKEMVTLFV